jgi:hypothetical protein
MLVPEVGAQAVTAVVDALQRFIPRIVIWAGLILIALGIVGLVWSDLLAASAHVTASNAWLAGTLQALGVGFIVGGLVDVLAISGLDTIRKAWEKERAESRAAFNRRGKQILEIPPGESRHSEAVDLLRRAADQLDAEVREALWELVREHEEGPSGTGVPSTA